MTAKGLQGLLDPLQEITASEEVRQAGSQLFCDLFEADLQCLDAKFKEKQINANETYSLLAELQSGRTQDQRQLRELLTERASMEDMIRRLTQAAEVAHQRHEALAKKAQLSEQQVQQCESVIAIQNQELSVLHAEQARNRVMLADFEASMCDLACAKATVQSQNKELQAQISKLQVDLDASREKCRVLMMQSEQQQQQHKQDLASQTREYEASLVGLVAEASRGASQQADALKTKLSTMKLEYDRLLLIQQPKSPLPTPELKPPLKQKLHPKSIVPSVTAPSLPLRQQHPLLQQLQRQNQPQKPQTRPNPTRPKDPPVEPADSQKVQQQPPVVSLAKVLTLDEVEQLQQEEELQRHTPQHQPLRKKKKLEAQITKKATIFDYYEES